MRKIPALVVSVGLLASLTACASQPQPGDDGCPRTGGASAAVTVSGAFGEEPEVDVPTPIVTRSTDVTTVLDGDGERVVDGSPVVIDYALYDGTTGEKVEDSGYDGTSSNPITVGGTTLGPLADALECSTVGSRLVVAIKGSELQGSTSGTPVEPDDEADAAFVAVVDVKQAFLPRADGDPQLGVQGLPAVVTAPDGAPGVTIPDADAPTEQRTVLVRKGHGPTLAADDTAVVQFTAVSWAAEPSVLGSTWTSTGTATALPLGQDGLPEYVLTALVDVPVGSQVMTVVPAKDTGGTEAAVYVFDVLGVL